MIINNTGLFSSDSDLWETPQWIFDELNTEFGFTLDVCATDDNKKCEEYINPTEDGLKQPWNGRVWCNPPYGRQIGLWIEKAQKEIHTNPYADLIVLLIPARTDTKWFHDYLYQKRNVELRFIKGRLKFGDKKDAPFPSMVAVIRKDNIEQ